MGCARKAWRWVGGGGGGLAACRAPESCLRAGAGPAGPRFCCRSNDIARRRSTPPPAAGGAPLSAWLQLRRRTRIDSVFSMVAFCSLRLMASSRTAPSPSETRPGVASIAAISRCCDAVEMIVRWWATLSSERLGCPSTASAITCSPSSEKLFSSSDRPHSFGEPRSSSATAAALALPRSTACSKMVCTASPLAMRTSDWFLIAGASDANCLLLDRSSVTRLGSDAATRASSSVSSFLVSMTTRFGTAAARGVGAGAGGWSNARMSEATPEETFIVWPRTACSARQAAEPSSKLEKVVAHTGW